MQTLLLEVDGATAGAVRAGGPEPVAELIGLGSSSGAVRARRARLLPRGLLALPLGFVPLGAGGALGGGAVPRGDLVEAEFLFDEVALGLGALAGAVPDVAVGMRWRLMVYPGAYGPLRPEELAGLRRRDVDLDNLRLHVRFAEPERTNGRRVQKAAGKRSGTDLASGD
ncbi:hypothetical protein ACFU3E_06920 [Streptomyces sp. NPDC057424]|uniref:hypothetical protein n=1 Tax=Streptomyces sp. NPDC057424 TaxID=3346127 RepID=UPI0036B5006E